jgi:hypothetical protein
MIQDHIAANLGIEADDFDYAPLACARHGLAGRFAQEGGLGKACLRTKCRQMH